MTYEQLLLEAQDRIDNDGRDTREVLEWFAAQLAQATHQRGDPNGRSRVSAS